MLEGAATWALGVASAGCGSADAAAAAALSFTGSTGGAARGGGSSVAPGGRCTSTGGAPKIARSSGPQNTNNAMTITPISSSGSTSINVRLRW